MASHNNTLFLYPSQRMTAANPKFTPASIRELTRNISLVENNMPGIDALLQNLAPEHSSNIIGVTGPPGAGKSTLVDALIGQFTNDGETVAVLCVDPTSSFSRGALLGDRIRMNRWHDHPNVFIRSLATRGSMGGLHPMIIEITAILQAFGFDKIIIETVGVGQTEVEIAGLADVTLVVLVPESGDDIQAMKAGIMEIADIFVVNKGDRPDADAFLSNLRTRLRPESEMEVPVLKSTATTGDGIKTIAEEINRLIATGGTKDRKIYMLTEKVWQLVRHERMRGLDKEDIAQKIGKAMEKGEFQLFRFARTF
jgi:LAO/AO transport system kinase